MDEKFFTTEQVANILQVHPFTILKFIKQGRLKGIKLGRVYRIKESDMKDFLEESAASGASKAPKENEASSQKTKPSKSEASKTEKHYDLNSDKKDDDNHYYTI
jgi:excisionase family DNA binding protein